MFHVVKIKLAKCADKRLWLNKPQRSKLPPRKSATGTRGSLCCPMHRQAIVAPRPISFGVAQPHHPNKHTSVLVVLSCVVFLFGPANPLGGVTWLWQQSCTVDELCRAIQCGWLWSWRNTNGYLCRSRILFLSHVQRCVFPSSPHRTTTDSNPMGPKKSSFTGESIPNLHLHCSKVQQHSKSRGWLWAKSSSCLERCQMGGIFEASHRAGVTSEVL